MPAYGLVVHNTHGRMLFGNYRWLPHLVSGFWVKYPHIPFISLQVIWSHISYLLLFPHCLRACLHNSLLLSCSTFKAPYL